MRGFSAQWFFINSIEVLYFNNQPSHTNQDQFKLNPGYPTAPHIQHIPATFIFPTLASHTCSAFYVPEAINGSTIHPVA